MTRMADFEDKDEQVRYSHLHLFLTQSFLHSLLLHGTTTCKNFVTDTIRNTYRTPPSLNLNQIYKHFSDLIDKIIYILQQLHMWGVTFVSRYFKWR